MHMLVRRDIAVGSQVAAYMYGPLGRDVQIFAKLMCKYTAVPWY